MDFKFDFNRNLYVDRFGSVKKLQDGDQKNGGWCGGCIFCLSQEMQNFRMQFVHFKADVGVEEVNGFPSKIIDEELGLANQFGYQSTEKLKRCIPV